MRRLFLAAFSTLALVARAQDLSDDEISLIRARLAEGSTRSWEIGTRAEVLLETDTPDFSVFSNNALPPSQDAPDSLDRVLSIANETVADRARSNSNATGAQPLMQDGSAGDPASVGVSVILANWTGQDDQDYAGAARDQLDFLLYHVPRTDDGAISHRVSEAQLWSDSVYMVPPFLAYYGVITENKTLLEEAYNQCSLYRDYLRDKDAGNLWKHIVEGSYSDEGHWSTGNGWAAAGMLRVLATIQHSQYADDLKDQQKDLEDWIFEIQAAMYDNHLYDNGLFANYADESVDGSDNFYDASGTAILAATVYRLALLRNVWHYLPSAETSRAALFATQSGNSSAYVHFDDDGWLTPVVNPLSFGDEGSKSPEGQAFALMLHTAWREWVDNGSVGANGSVRIASAPALLLIGACVVSLAAALL
ncbi:glycoside hydrolase family 105 protein [Schizophyllum commune H4-8]|uniref:Glycoside hydrolase family 105 protein n=1 Tax=Schizophyllum commune (strain H4-8 / FGSC 9210) TaxID=578458 RepID=D8Q159_SCHCM|nr:glycoside hydrolase family 105 protein [Schizophyllum commune H4-8]KAI5895280.1 glycoside hydrolase family 105 protein [Schizophyllum commune H4-8]